MLPGISELLSYLHERSVPKALVTGSPRDQAELIVQKHFQGLFDVVVSGIDVNRGKPHPEPYSNAISELKIQHPHHCLAIENAPLGVRSARRAGLLVYGVLHNSPVPEEKLTENGAEAVFSSHGEALDTIKTLTFSDLVRKTTHAGTPSPA